MAIFNSFLYVYQRVSYLDRDFSWITNPICSSLPVETGVNASRRAAASRMALEGGASAIAVQGEMVRFFPPEHGNLHGKMRSETLNPWIWGYLVSAYEFQSTWNGYLYISPRMEVQLEKYWWVLTKRGNLHERFAYSFDGFGGTFVSDKLRYDREKVL